LAAFWKQEAHATRFVACATTHFYNNKSSRAADGEQGTRGKMLRVDFIKVTQRKKGGVWKKTLHGGLLCVCLFFFKSAQAKKATPPPLCFAFSYLKRLASSIYLRNLQILLHYIYYYGSNTHMDGAR
jgi:hypothetical protein